MLAGSPNQGQEFAKMPLDSFAYLLKRCSSVVVHFFGSPVVHGRLLWKIRAESYGTIRNDILGLCIADNSLEFMIIPESESSSGHSQEHCHSYIVFFRLRSLPGSMCSGDMNPGRAIQYIF